MKKVLYNLDQTLAFVSRFTEHESEVGLVPTFTIFKKISFELQIISFFKDLDMMVPSLLHFLIQRIRKPKMAASDLKQKPLFFIYVLAQL